MIISDATPLIMAAKIERLGLLPLVFTEGIFIPDVVYQEITSSSLPGAKEVAEAKFIEVITPKPNPIQEAKVEHLDPGEAAAIVLAFELNSKYLLMDDYAGRSTALSLNLRPIGIVGALAIAKKKGLINLLRPEIDKLVDKGLWLSDKVIETVLKQVGEAK